MTSKNILPGTPVIVSENAPFHAGRTGIFDFYGEKRSDGTAVIIADAPKDRQLTTRFAVANEHVKKWKPPMIKK